MVVGAMPMTSFHGVGMPDVEAILRGYWGSPQYNSDKVPIGRQHFDAQEPSMEDRELFIAEMFTAVRKPIAGPLIARNSPKLWDAIRLLNKVTGEGYGGAAARGERLVANPLETRDTGSGGGFPGTSPLTGWYLSVASIANRRLYPASGTVDLTISSRPVLSHVYFGWQDDVRRPKASLVQLVLDSDPWPEEVMDFTWDSMPGEGPAIYELKQPWLIRPGASYRVSVRHYQTGDDYLQPIGYSVKRALDIIASIAT